MKKCALNESEKILKNTVILSCIALLLSACALLLDYEPVSFSVSGDGMVALGGTDFFLAGVKRTAEPGAMIGVHSWSGLIVEGAKVPKNDPEHQKYLLYYKAMGIPAEFYWYTLRAAPSGGMHWMSVEETFHKIKPLV